MLQPEHCFRIEQVLLALTSPLVLATDIKRAMSIWCARRRVGRAMTQCDLFGKDLKPHAAEL